MRTKHYILIFFFAIVGFSIGASVPTTTKLRVKVVGSKGESLINLNTTVQHVSGFYPTTQIEKNVYGDPNSPEETLSITGIPEGQTGEIIIKIDKLIKIP